MSDQPADLPQNPSQFGETPPAVPVSIEGALGAAVMGLLFLITFANVVVRYLTDVSFAFTEEYSVALMVVMVLLGSAVAFAMDRQLRIESFILFLPRPGRWLLELAIMALCSVFFVVLAVYAGFYTWDEYRFEVMSPGLGIPQWRYTIALPVFSTLIALRIAGRGLRVFRAGC